MKNTENAEKHQGNQGKAYTADSGSYSDVHVLEPLWKPPIMYPLNLLLVLEVRFREDVVLICFDNWEGGFQPWP